MCPHFVCNVEQGARLLGRSCNLGISALVPVSSVFYHLDSLIAFCGIDYTKLGVQTDGKVYAETIVTCVPIMLNLRGGTRRLTFCQNEQGVCPSIRRTGHVKSMLIGVGLYIRRFTLQPHQLE